MRRKSYWLSLFLILVLFCPHALHLQWLGVSINWGKPLGLLGLIVAPWLPAVILIFHYRTIRAALSSLPFGLRCPNCSHWLIGNCSDICAECGDAICAKQRRVISSLQDELSFACAGGFRMRLDKLSVAINSDFEKPPIIVTPLARK